MNLNLRNFNSKLFYGANINDRKFKTGFIFKLDGNCIPWCRLKNETFCSIDT